MIRHLRDAANLCTLAGLTIAVLGIALCLRGQVAGALLCLLWACACDWLDGPIARRLHDRSEADRRFGAGLDSLADVVYAAVLPAVLLLTQGELRLSFVPGAVAIVAAGAIRLAHYGAHGLDDRGWYTGLAVDNNAIALTVVFLVQPLLAPATFAWLVYACVVALAVLNVSSLPTPKLTGRWYAAFAVFVAVMTVVYGLRLVGA